MRNHTVEVINNELQLLIESEYKPGSARESVRAALDDPRFVTSVENARDDLGIVLVNFSKSLSFIDSEDLYEKVEARLRANSSKKNIQEVINICERVIDEANLSWGWLDFIMAIVVFDESPMKLLNLIKPEPMLEVQEISEDGNQLILNIKKGASSKEYHNAWKILKSFLTEPSTYEIKETELKNRIYLDHLDGLTYGEIAKKYYPNEFKMDYQHITDKVKKIVKRFNTVKNRDYRRRSY